MLLPHEPPLAPLPYHRGSSCAPKLTAEEVYEIRDLLAGGKLLQKDIARRYGVSDPTITYIKNRVTWAKLQ